MEQIRYHPLISDEEDMVPMFSSPDRTTVSKSHAFFLEEIVPHYYRLCSTKPQSRNAIVSVKVHCPLCGKPMMAITAPVDSNRLSLYRCDKC